MMICLTLQSSTGSALAFTVTNAALGTQNSGTSSADATTITGQAAALGATQATGGVYAESQGASSATTNEGNALSLGSGFSGAQVISPPPPSGG